MVHKYPMLTYVNAPTNVTTVGQVFDLTDLSDLICQVEESQIELNQQYPRRLFSSPRHQDLWLQYFREPMNQLFGNFSLQQIFLAYELPGSHFSYHHSHPAIGHVGIFSLDDWEHSAVRVIHDPGVDLNYAGPSSFAQKMLSSDEYSDFPFRQNELLIINHRPDNRAWGFTSYIPQNTTKRSIWIYLS
jgi:hypothetical protein